VPDLTVGRIGLELDLGHPSQLREGRNIDNREFVLSGFLRSTTLTNTNYLRDELLEQQGQIVAVTYTLDTHFDAFYLLADSTIESIETSYLRRGLWLYEINLFRIGGTARTEFQSNVTGTVLDNTVGLIESETRPFIAPPVGATVFDWNVTGLTTFTRATEDGNIDVYTSNGVFTEDATWGCTPANYYKGAAKVYVSGQVRAGLDVPQDPTDWQLQNGLIRIQPNGTGDELLIDLWDGVSAWESQKAWKFQLGGADLSAFTFMSVLKNDPENVIIRLQTGGTLARHTIDLQLRRGSPQVYCNWFYTGSASTLKVVGVSTEAGTAITPTGATGTVGLRATSNDAGGNRYTLFSANGGTNDTTNGGLSLASTQRLNTAIGFEINGSSASAGNTADDLALQYFGMLGERVRAVWR
jgi:hypothetical protein